jgi:hypothetical protein
MPALVKLLDLGTRRVFHLRGSSPAVFLISDTVGGGILVNTPPYTPACFEALQSVAPLNYVFFPSRFGARDAAAWRAAGVQLIAYGAEARAIGRVDIMVDRGDRLARDMDFLPMSGRTESTCALRLKSKPGVIFFGPALQQGPDGWPALIACVDDYSYENRLLGAIGLRRLRYEYAFTDDFAPPRSCWGPGASVAIRGMIDGLLGG